MKNLGIFSKIFALIILSSLITGIVLLSIFLKEKTKSLENAMVQENKLLAETAATSIENSYLVNTFPFTTLEKISSSKNVIFVWVVDSNGNIYYTNNSNEWGEKIQDSFLGTTETKVRNSIAPSTLEHIKLIASPIKIEINKSPWTLFLGVSTKHLKSAKYAIIFKTIVFFIFFIIFLASIALYFSKTLIKPLDYLMKGVKEIGKGNLDYRLSIKTKDEFGKLALLFNKTAQKLKAAREREKLVSQMKTEFITIAAHQLRTPSSGVKWTLKMMLDGDMGKITKDQKNFLKQAYQTNERMIHLVNDLLNVSRIEEGKFGYTFGFYDLNKFIKQIVEENQHTFKKKSLNLVLISKAKIPKIKIDTERLRLAIQNLLDNAHDYTEKGGVEIKLSKKQGYAKIDIKDTGVGIPKEQIKNLFTKFFRGTNVMRKGLGVEGTGLGLYIAKNIIEKHKGTIKVQSKLNKGTTMHITIPIQKN